MFLAGEVVEFFAGEAAVFLTGVPTFGVVLVRPVVAGLLLGDGVAL